MNDRFLELSQIGKRYPTPDGEAVIVRGVDLRIAEGEFVCLIGHSGCGKSTVLSMVMGLTGASEGGIVLAGREVAGPGLDRGVVFQSPALLPWLSAGDNVLLAVDQVMAGARRDARWRRALECLEQVGLGPTYRREANASVFSVESHVTYQREVHEGDLLEFRTKPIGFDAKRVHYIQTMYRLADGALSATAEWVVLHVDMKTRRTAPIPEAIQARLRDLQARQRDLPVPAEAGRSIQGPGARAQASGSRNRA